MLSFFLGKARQRKTTTFFQWAPPHRGLEDEFVRWSSIKIVKVVSPCREGYVEVYIVMGDPQKLDGL